MFLVHIFRHYFLALYMLSCCLLISNAAHAQNYDKYGGWEGLKIPNSSGYFRIAKVNGHYWFVTPEGNAFWSMGMDWTAGWMWPAGSNYPALISDSLYNSPPLGYAPGSLQNKAKYENDPVKWMNSVKSRLQSWGFNHNAGASYPVPNMTECTDLLAFSYEALNAGCRTIVTIGWHPFVDIFDTKYKDACERVSERVVKPKANDPYLMGWFVDNELIWNLNDKESLVDGFIKLPAEAPGKQHWVSSFLKTRYPSLEALNTAYGTNFTSWTGTESTSVTKCLSIPDDQNHPARYNDKLDFMTEIVEHYYKTACEAIKKRDPNHLIFSERLIMGGQHTEVKNKDGSQTYNRPFMERAWEVAGKYCDVMSVNCYWKISMYEDTHQVWSRMYSKAGKPILFTEWSPKANDSIAYNTGWNTTQMDRGRIYEDYTKDMLDMRADPANPASDRICLGHQWFCYTDYAPLRTDDDYHTQSGLLNGKDEPYLPLTDVMTTVNRQIYAYAAQDKSLVVPAAPTAVAPIEKDPQAVDTKVAEAIGTANLTFEWTPVPGAVSYTLLYSPERCFPEDQTIMVGGIINTKYRPILPVAQGQWYWTVKAVDAQGRGGHYLKTVPFYVGSVTNDQIDAVAALRGEQLSAWAITDNTLTGGDGTMWVFRDRNRKVQGYSSIRTVFTVNSYNLRTKAKNEGTSEIACKWVGPKLDYSGISTLRFKLYPQRFVDTTGAMVSPSKYLYFRMVDANAGVVVDVPVDPAGNLPRDSWSTVDIPLGSKTRNRVSQIMFYIKCGDTKLAWDQRIVFYIDDISPAKSL